MLTPFDAEAIARETILHVSAWHYHHLQNMSGLPIDFGPIAAACERGLLHDHIILLVQIANGEIDRGSVNDARVKEIMASIGDVLAACIGRPWGDACACVPETFWRTPMGKVVQAVQFWLFRSELINYSEAAAILYPNEQLTQRAAVMRIQRLVEVGDLTGYIDPYEPNPRHAQRVSRQAVERLLYTCVSGKGCCFSHRRGHLRS